MNFQAQKHHTAFLAHLAIEDSDNSLARILRSGKQGICSVPMFHAIRRKENAGMVDKLAGYWLADDGPGIYLSNSMYLL